MDKPTKRHHHEPCYDYHEIIRWIESKYDIKTSGYKRHVDGEYRDFWHWVLDSAYVTNGTVCYFSDEWDIDDEEYSPWWVKEIMSLIVKEFYPDRKDMRFYVEW